MKTGTKELFAGRYELAGWISTSGNVVVLAADDVVLNRRVVLNVFSAQLSTNPDFIKAFEEATAIASTLAHPNILAFHDSAREPMCYLATEFATGGNLRQMPKAGRRLSPSQGLAVGLEAARALQYLHARDLAHKGIDPTCLRFDLEGRLRLGGFGISHALSSFGLAPTGGYQAPEQRAGETPGAPADIYCLALAINEAVTGQEPEPESVTKNVLGTQDQLGSLYYVLERAVAEDPTERPTASELVKDLLGMAGLMSRPEPLPLVGVSIRAFSGDVAKPDTSSDSSEETARTRHPSSTTVHDSIGHIPYEGTDAPYLDDKGKPIFGEKTSLARAARARRRSRMLLAALVVAIAGTIGIVSLIDRTPAPSVPNVIGETQSTAIEAALAQGWHPEVILVRTEASNRGEVVAAQPDNSNRNGTPVLVLSVSLGEPLIPIPSNTSVYGLTPAQATEIIEATGLDVENEVPIPDPAVPTGFVVGVDAPEGTFELATGTPVGLLISTGPPDLIVPVVPSDSFAETAQQTLVNAGLFPEAFSEVPSSQPAGTVIGFDPPSGTSVDPGASVTIIVSSGAAVVILPNVVGLTVSQAVEHLEARGFVVIRGGLSDSDTITAMSPDPEQLVALGSEVELS